MMVLRLWLPLALVIFLSMHNTSTTLDFIAFVLHTGIIVALAVGWDLALVMIGMLPFIAIAGAILAKVTTLMSGRMNVAMSSASSMAQQSLSQIRTVSRD